MQIRITDRYERNVLFEYASFSIVERNGVYVVTVRHPTATDFEHDSLVMAEIYLTPLRLTYGHERVVSYEAHMIGVYEWGKQDPLKGATTCDHEHCEPHLITTGETFIPKKETLSKYIPTYRPRDPYAVPVHVDFLDLPEEPA